MNTELIDRFNMCPPACRVLVALSGGADSVYLLHNLFVLGKQRGFEICAAHYHHGLRGEEADRDEEFCRSLCESLGIDYVCGHGDVSAYAAEKGIGTEEAARDLRYGFLHDAAARLKADRIATAHTADDNAETLLLNLARGSGLRGLGAIPPVRGILIRPLLLTSRYEIEDYLAENGLFHVEDSTNASDDFSRNKIRHGAVPVLREINSGFARNASRAALLLRDDEDCLESMADGFIERSYRGGSLSSAALLELPEAVSTRVIRILCGRGLSEKNVISILEIARGTELACVDVPGMRVKASRGRLYFGNGRTESFAGTVLPESGTVRPDGADFTVAVSDAGGTELKTGTFNSFFFNSREICGSILCTPRRDGDKIRIVGRGCTKSVAKLFSEKRMTPAECAMTPVLRDDSGVLAVYGFGQAERAAGGALKVEIQKDREVNDL